MASTLGAGSPLDSRKSRRGTSLNWIAIFGGALGQPLSGPQVERDAAPAPVVDREAAGDVGLSLRLGVYFGFLAVPSGRFSFHPARAVLAADHVAANGLEVWRGDGPQNLDLLISKGVGMERSGWLHGHERHQLQEVVLEDVSAGAGLFVECAAALDSERLGHRDLDVIDEAPIPDRLEDAVAEPEDQQVSNRLLPR